MAAFTVEPVSPIAANETDALFLINNPVENPRVYTWYKGQTDTNSSLLIASFEVPLGTNSTGPAYTHRERIFPNGSLLIQNVSEEDTGNYTLRITDGSYDQHLATTPLYVYSE